MNAGEAHDDLCAQLRWVRAADNLTAWFTSHALRARPALIFDGYRTATQSVPYIPAVNGKVLRRSLDKRYNTCYQENINRNHIKSSKNRYVYGAYHQL